MVSVTNPPNVNLSQLVIDANLAMALYNITLGAGQTVDTLDLSAHAHTGAAGHGVVLDHNSLTNRTREICIPVTAGYSTGTFSIWGGRYVSLQMPDAAITNFHFTQKLPGNLITLDNIRMVFGTPDGVGTDIVWSSGIEAAADGEIYNTHHIVDNLNPLTVDEGLGMQIESIKDAMDFSVLNSNDVVGVYVRRDGTDANDDFQAILYLLSIILEYTADM